MKRIFYYISLLAITCALVGFLFNLQDYDIFRQLDKIASINFPNPLAEFNEIYDATMQLSNINNLDLQWYEYIVFFFKWVGTLFYVPILFFKDLFLDLFGGFQAIIFLLGF